LTQIIPAILAKTEEEYKDAVEKINNTPGLSDGFMHIDFADGDYVDNKTVYWQPIKDYPLNQDKEAHLMVDSPKGFITRLSLLGFKRVIIHLDALEIEHTIEMIKERQMEVGLAINPEVSVEDLKPFLDKIDLVLVMGVHPGFQHHEFIPETLAKIKELAELRGNFLIAVDGGVKADNAKEIIEAGADNLIIGSHLLEGDIEENLEAFWEALQ
jgi:ribulose-phosphate 3-epimerase